MSEQERDEEALVLYERVLRGYEVLAGASADISQMVGPKVNSNRGGGGGGGGGVITGDSDVSGIMSSGNAISYPPLLPPTSPLSLPHLAAMVNVAMTWKRLGVHLAQAREMFERSLRGYEHMPSIGLFRRHPTPRANSPAPTIPLLVLTLIMRMPDCLYHCTFPYPDSNPTPTLT